jgi:hypothetical protein
MSCSPDRGAPPAPHRPSLCLPSSPARPLPLQPGDYANALVSLLPTARVYPASGINANLQWCAQGGASTAAPRRSVCPQTRCRQGSAHRRRSSNPCPRAPAPPFPRPRCGVNFDQLPNGVGFGGQPGHFGVWLDAAFDSGHSRPNATYARCGGGGLGWGSWRGSWQECGRARAHRAGGLLPRRSGALADALPRTAHARRSPSLSHEQTFAVDAVEAWLLAPPPEEEEEEARRRAAAARGGRGGASILTQVGRRP